MPMSAGEIAFANSMSQIDEIRRIETRLEQQDAKIQQLQASITELAKAMAELSDELAAYRTTTE